jgi:hypothetical protein
MPIFIRTISKKRTAVNLISRKFPKKDLSHFKTSFLEKIKLVFFSPST